MTDMEGNESFWLFCKHPFNSFEVLEQVLIKVLS